MFSMTTSDAVVDVSFPMRGAALPLDHGYALFGAVARLVPDLHEQPLWGVHPVLGERTGVDTLRLTFQSRLKVRLPSVRIGALLPLSKAWLEVDGHKINLGFPQIMPLTPSAHLRARLVTIKGFHDEVEPFADALRRQIVAMDDLDQPPASIEVVVGPRRVLRVKDKIVVGFPVGLTGLRTAASLRIQERGIGGRRHMGAGIFVPPGRRG